MVIKGFARLCEAQKTIPQSNEDGSQLKEKREKNHKKIWQNYKINNRYECGERGAAGNMNGSKHLKFSIERSIN